MIRARLAVWPAAGLVGTETRVWTDLSRWTCPAYPLSIAGSFQSSPSVRCSWLSGAENLRARCRAFRLRQPIWHRRLQAVLSGPQFGAQDEPAILFKAEEGAHAQTHLQHSRPRATSSNISRRPTTGADTPISAASVPRRSKAWWREAENRLPIREQPTSLPAILQQTRRYSGPCRSRRRDCGAEGLEALRTKNGWGSAWPRGLNVTVASTPSKAR